MLVEENGKVYEIDPNTKTVTAAATSRDQLETPVPDPQPEWKLGDRVEVDGKAGQIILKSNTMYGDSVAVRFDDGSTETYLAETVKATNVKAPDYETPIREVISRFESYKEMPAYTRDEIEAKAAEARWLNLRAKSLVTDSKIPFSEANALDHVVVITGSDVLDLREAAERLDGDARLKELKGTDYSLHLAEGAAPVMGVRNSGGTDWLDEVLDVELPTATDGDLATLAVEVASRFSREQLEDENFRQLAASFVHTASQEERDKFSRYFEQAVSDRLKEPVVAKVANTENLDDFDATAIFV